jgi:hypothetical protein
MAVLSVAAGWWPAEELAGRPATGSSMDNGLVGGQVKPERQLMTGAGTPMGNRVTGLLVD